MKSINQLLAEELQVNDSQINAAVALMDDGATVPFIARYRKEATGGLDDTQLRRLEEEMAAPAVYENPARLNKVLERHARLLDEQERLGGQRYQSQVEAALERTRRDAAVQVSHNAIDADIEDKKVLQLYLCFGIHRFAPVKYALHFIEILLRDILLNAF